MPANYMRIVSTKRILNWAIALMALWACSTAAQAQWSNLNHSPGAHLDTCLLLTNGDVMCHEYGSANWHRLRPDNTGSYKNGTWDSPGIASMPNGTDTSDVVDKMNNHHTCNPCAYAPTYFASAVLKDGRVVVIGGEYNTNGQTWTNIGFLYDPAANSWSTQLTEPFGTGQIGDDQSVVLKDGTMLIGNIGNGNVASFDPNTLTFTALNPTGKLDKNDEENWTILPNGSVLTVDANRANSFEIYDPASKTWGSSGTTAGITLADFGGNCDSREIGPAVARPDGTIIQFSGSTSGQNAVYTISSSNWAHASGMDFPSISSAQYGAADAPASLLPNGKVLIMSSPVTCHLVNPMDPSKGYTIFNAGSHFFEWDGANLTQVTDSSNAGSFVSYQGRMLLLPTGEVLLTAFDQNSTDTVQLYSNGGAPDNSWRPIIDGSSLPGTLGLGTTYPVSGQQFNGFSQGASYGDDAQMATNYPLVQITDNAGHKFFAKTHDPSRMGVVTQPSAETVSTNFDVPTGLATGTGSLVVITNGIPSDPVFINVEPATTLTFGGGQAFSADYSDVVAVSAHLADKTGGTAISGEAITFKLGAGTGTETCSAVTDGGGNASCNLTPFEVPANTYTLTASFAGDSSHGASTVSSGFTITKEDTAVAFTANNHTTEDYHDATTVEAQLTDPDDATPLAGKSITFSLGAGTGTETCTATTNGSGVANCSITPNEAAGNYTLTVSYAGDSFYKTSSASVGFTITKEETTTKFTMGSDTVIPVGHTATLSAILTEDSSPGIQGRSVTITLGTGGGAQSCTGTTDATGKAQCTISNVNQPLGPNTVSAAFAGDAFYLPSSDSEAVILFAFLARGSMEIGNLNAGTGSNVTFWGSQWTKANSLTGGDAPNQFKGFADTAPQTCGATPWTATPANSPGPPATVPSYMGVIASSVVAASGDTLSGDVPYIVVVKTNPGYGPSPGHAGTGTVVAVYCHP